MEVASNFVLSSDFLNTKFFRDLFSMYKKKKKKNKKKTKNK